MKDFMSVREVAKILGISSSTVYRLIQSGDFPVTRINKTLRITREQLEKYLEKHRNDTEVN